MQLPVLTEKRGTDEADVVARSTKSGWEKENTRPVTVTVTVVVVVVQLKRGRTGVSKITWCGRGVERGDTVGAEEDGGMGYMPSWAASATVHGNIQMEFPFGRLDDSCSFRGTGKRQQFTNHGIHSKIGNCHPGDVRWHKEHVRKDTKSMNR